MLKQKRAHYKCQGHFNLTIFNKIVKIDLEK